MAADYASFLAALLARAGPLATPADDPPSSIAVERGACWVSHLVASGSPPDLAPLLPLADAAFSWPAVSIGDGAGQHRAVYPPLLRYAATRAVASADPSVADAFRPAVRRWLVESSRVDPAATPTFPSILPARLGDRTAAAAWSALADFAAAELLDDATAKDAAARPLAALLAAQRPDGSFLTPTAADNLESLWFHELQIAHAVGSYALQSGDPAALSAAWRAADYHQAETQPDHATSQPWSLTAFLTDPATHPMADQLLHSAAVQHPGGADGVTLILLADALYSLRRAAAR